MDPRLLSRLADALQIAAGAFLVEWSSHELSDLRLRQILPFFQARQSFSTLL
jgi:hypothetical protein